jgi:hypothetical protein
MSIIIKGLLITALGTATLYADHEVVKKSSVGQYAKPGASIEMRYESPRVDIVETAEIKVIFMPEKKYNQINIRLTFDETLEALSSSKTDFTIDTSEKRSEYPIQIAVRSSIPGVHLIRILVSSEKESRAFTVPVYIGEQQDKNRKKSSKQFKILHAKEKVY